MATPKRAYNTLLKRETTPASGTYTTLGGVTDLNLPELQAETVDTTDMEASSAARTCIPTLIALGDCTFTLNFDSSDATQEQLMADLVAGTSRLYQIALSDSGTAFWAFNAYVTRFAIGAPVDGKLTAAVTLKPSGPVTRTT